MRILILRPDRIGDCVLFSGALKHFRARWPEAKIDLMVRPAVVPLFALCPHADRVVSTARIMPWITVRRLFRRGTWRLERLLTRDGVRRFWYPRYDLAVYPVSAPTETYLDVVRCLPAAEKWGFGGDQLRLGGLRDGRNRPETVFTRFWANPGDRRWLHELERTALFLRHFGLGDDPLAPELWLSEADRRFARAAVPERSALGLFVSAGSRWRQWPAAKWAEMARRQDVARSVVCFGAATDRGIVSGIVAGLAGAPVRVTDFTGRTSLRQLAACLGRCAACVSTDSAGLHLAVAQNVPAVGILGGYHFGRFYPWGDPRIHRVAALEMDCRHCNNNCVYGDFRCVRDITVDMVLSELRQAGAVSALNSHCR